jgi:hypothetical protein
MAMAIERDGDGQRALLEGDRHRASEAFTSAAELYRRSWEAAPPGGYGRLVGMLKAGVLAGGGAAQADYVRAALSAGDASPTASYARAIAALIAGDYPAAEESAAGMRAGSDAFGRTADAIEALADHDPKAYGEALRAIVRDFETRDQHLTGVAIADTAVMLEQLAERRGMATRATSPVLPGTA